MLTRPFTRLVVAFGVRRITQRRLVEEFLTGSLVLVPFGALVGWITSRICTKIRISGVRSDVWTTLVVFLIGDVLMEWLLPSLGCLPLFLEERDDMDEYVSSIFNSGPKFLEDEFHYNLRWLLQSYGLYCPENFANSDSLLTPDATAILFSIRLVFLCFGVHIGESLGCFVALTGGIATGKSTVAKMFVDCNYDVNDSLQTNRTKNGRTTQNNKRNGKNNKRNSKNSSSTNNNNNNNHREVEDDELIKLVRAHDEHQAVGVFGSIWKLLGNLFGMVFSFGFTDDASAATNAVYNEGTVELICADSIAHNILLPPQVLAQKSTEHYYYGDDDGNDDNDGKIGSDDDDSSSGIKDDSENKGVAIHRPVSDNHHNNIINEDQTPILKIVSPSDSVYHRILKAFEGKDILNPRNKHIDRLKLGAIIFKDKEERKKLNRITHPKILSVLLKKLFRSVFFGYADITMADLPLLFESGRLSWLFGVTICVVTSKEVQLARLMERNPELSREDSRARIDSQMNLSVKKRKADIVIDNNGDLEQLREQVEDARRDIMGRLYGIGMSLLQMLLLIGGSTSIAVSSKFYTHWQQ